MSSQKHYISYITLHFEDFLNKCGKLGKCKISLIAVTRAARVKENQYKVNTWLSHSDWKLRI